MSPQATTPAERLAQIRARIAAAAPPSVDAERALLAASKMQSSAAIRALAAAGQRRFGENYVQEAVAKRRDLSDLDLEWHLIGPLQSNKARLAAHNFDWIQSVDRLKLIALLAGERPVERGPLNVLIQVNFDDEATKSGCRIEDIASLATAIEAEPALRLRGLMAIPAPVPDFEVRAGQFRALRAAFDATRLAHPQIDTLSVGMSEDFELALASGSTLVRIGTALFGPRPSR